jgi:DNA-binding NarL/FixJ family response regulator
MTREKQRRAVARDEGTSVQRRKEKMDAMAVLTVLIVDDNPIYLRAVSALLANKSEVEVVGCALTGEEALELNKLLRPELILLDLRMPGMGGLETTRQLKALPSCPRIAIVTAGCGEEHRKAAMAVGADDFICKDRLTSELRRLIDDWHAEFGHRA